MQQMNQKPHLITLLDFTEGEDHPFGNVLGKESFRSLSDYIDTHPQYSIYEVSLKGIVATDASFPRESVLTVAKLYRQTKSFFMTNVHNPDTLDNWDYAAKAKEQPIISWDRDSYRVLGPELTSSTSQLLDYVLTKKGVLAAQVAADLDISVQNASTRLKKLVSEGYILRTEVAAESGGIEYIYQAIK